MTATRAPFTPADTTLYRLRAPAFQVAAYGDPKPQGSKNISKAGNLYESARGLKPWRLSIAAAAHRTLTAAWEPLEGPIVADFVFTMPKPASRARMRNTHTLPDRFPDLSKLVRAAEDALGEDVPKIHPARPRRVFLDDAQIVAYRRCTKLYVGDYDPDVLPRPGVLIRLWRYPVENGP